MMMRSGQASEKYENKASDKSTVLITSSVLVPPMGIRLTIIRAALADEVSARTIASSPAGHSSPQATTCGQILAANYLLSIKQTKK
jgi:hypothetical protein